MSEAVYRFLPWSRRGLAAALPDGRPDEAPRPGRSVLKVQATLSGGGSAENQVEMMGPGDVIGLDPTVIVRTTPRPNATDVEPNYLVAVDLDDPELPWLFTPEGAPVSGRLPPWLVLVVVRQRNGVTLSVPRGVPLPQLRIDGGASDELPDLADSWAWAHSQLLDSDAHSASPSAIGSALRDHPDRNVSRLLCPRRLDPGASWYACIVPAFDAGVQRGLGRSPDPSAVLTPAWDGPDSITLPLYFHWEFTTGPAGDFEALARRLAVHQATEDVGVVRMHVGAAGTPLLDMPVGDPERFLDMDGALRAPKLQNGKLGQVPDRLRTGFSAVTSLVADAADGVLDQVIPGSEGEQPFGPPVTGGFVTRRAVVDETSGPLWFRELNLDPRTRVAAGLGAQVLRINQEEIVHAAWQQVGSVLDTEAALSRARLALEAARRFYNRHVVPQPLHRLLHLAAPMSSRTRVGGVTLPEAIRTTSVPDTALDPAMRRLLSPTGRFISHSARSLRLVPGRGLRPALVQKLAEGMPEVDATVYDSVPLTGLGDSQPAAGSSGTMSLSPFGAHIEVPTEAANDMVRLSREAMRDPLPSGPLRTMPRLDLRQVGILTDRHLRAARSVARFEDGDQGGLPTQGTVQILDRIHEAAGGAAGAGVLVERVGRISTVRTLVLGRDRTLAAHDPVTHEVTDVARLAPTLARERIGDIVSALPPGTLSTTRSSAAGPAELRAGVVVGEVRVHRPDVDQPAGLSLGVGGLNTEAMVLSRFESAYTQVVGRTDLGTVEPAKRLVGFDIAAAGQALLERANPEVSHIARRDASILIGGEPVGPVATGAVTTPGWSITPTVDRVMAYPVLDLPAYAMLAEYDRNRFCPGIEEIPPDSVTLLETNPRFVNSFLAGLNHEVNRELLWRRYPTDQRGTPFRCFWDRTDGKKDIEPLTDWSNGLLVSQADNPDGTLVLLIRGQLLRRYPNTVVLAIRSLGPREPSQLPDDIKRPILFGSIGSDISFFGFDLVREQVIDDPGWFFALMEPPTEPRFGLDETPSPSRASIPTTWDEVAWSDFGSVDPGEHMRWMDLDGLAVLPGPGHSGEVAGALFQRPFQVLVLGKHLLKTDP